MFRLFKSSKKVRKTPRKTKKIVKDEKEEEKDPLQSDFPEPEFLDEGVLGTDGCIYHQKAKIEGQDVRLNDSILVLGDEKGITYCGIVIKMFSNEKDEKFCVVNWHCKYFEIPDELKSLVLRRELLLSEVIDTIPLDAIKSLITVYDNPGDVGRDVNKEGDCLTDVFFCNRGYFSTQAKFVALSTIRRLLKLSEESVEIVEGKSKYDLCISKLQLNRVSFVSGREKEIDRIKELISTMLMKNGNGGCIYISGVPGTGKTLCVREVIHQMAQKVISGDIEDFEYYEINCMSLDDNAKLYSEMWYQLVGERLGSQTSLKMLNDLFLKDPPHKYIILLIDEIDILLTTKQSELYCLFEWASLPKSHLILICVANLMDLDNRLKPKLQSRLGSANIHFYSYKADELMRIITDRIGNLNIFHQSALEYLCRSVANFGGDARKALGICKRSVDLFLKSKKKNMGLIKLAHVVEAVKEIQNVRGIDIFAKLSDLHKYFLVAFVNDSRITKRTIIPARDIVRRAITIMKQVNSKALVSSTLMLMAGKQLCDMKILTTQNEEAMNIASKVSLMCVEHDIIIYMKDIKKFNRFINIKN